MRHRYVCQYHPVAYGLGFAITREVLRDGLYFAKTYGLYRRGGRLRYRNYGREIKGGLTLFEAMERCTAAAMRKVIA